jgi:hypothetical protein
MKAANKIPAQNQKTPRPRQRPSPVIKVCGTDFYDDAANPRSKHTQYALRGFKDFEHSDKILIKKH